MAGEEQDQVIEHNSTGACDNAAARQVRPCLGCNHCGMEGPCVHKDDFTTVLRPKLEKADMVVFCSPMYYFGFRAQIKTVIDRFYALNGTLHSPRKTIADYMGWEDVGSGIDKANAEFKACVGGLK